MATRADVRRLAGARLHTTGAMTTIAGGRRLSRRDVEVLGLSLDAPLPAYTPPLTEEQAMGLPPYGRAVTLICAAMAGTNWYARRRNREQGIWDTLDPQPSIVADTYPLADMWHYRWAAGEDLINYGNHFGLLGDLDWRTGRAGWLIPLPADEMWIITDPARPAWYQWAIAGETFDADEIFHVSAGNRSGRILGRGVLEQYADWLPGVAAAEDYARQQFAAGALPPAILTAPVGTDAVQAEDLKSKWRDLIRTREPIILPNGSKLEPVVGNAVNAQMVEARTWSAEQVANAVGVPGWKLGLPGPTMTYQNIETADIDFVRDSVDRFGRPLTSAITKWLLPAATEVEWDYDSRMRSDSKGKADVVTELKAAGILDEDEARARYNLPPRVQPSAPPPAGPGAGGTVPVTGGAAAAAAAAASQLNNVPGVTQP